MLRKLTRVGSLQIFFVVPLNMIPSISSLNLIYKVTSAHILVNNKSTSVSLEVCADNKRSTLCVAYTSLAACLTVVDKLPVKIGCFGESRLL